MKKITRRKFAEIKNGMMFVKDLDGETVKFFTKGYDVSETTLRRVNKSRNFDEYRELVAYDCRNNAKNREKIIKDKVCDEKDVEIAKLQLNKLALEYRLEIADELITKQSTVINQLTGRIIKEYRKSNIIIAIEEFDVSETILRRVNKSRNFDEYREMVAYDCRNNAKNREKIIKDKVCDEKDVEITKLQLDKLALEHELEIADELITKQLTIINQLTGRIVKEYRKSNTIIIIAIIGIILSLIALFAKVIGL